MGVGMCTSCSTLYGRCYEIYLSSVLDAIHKMAYKDVRFSYLTDVACVQLLLQVNAHRNDAYTHIHSYTHTLT
jgi:hypothetical protein